MGTIPLKNMCKIFAHRKTDYNNIFKEKKCCRELEFETANFELTPIAKLWADPN